MSLVLVCVKHMSNRAEELVQTDFKRTVFAQTKVKEVLSSNAKISSSSQCFNYNVSIPNKSVIFPNKIKSVIY